MPITEQSPYAPLGQALPVVPCTTDAETLVLQALDAAAQAVEPSGDLHAETAARAAVLHVLRSILHAEGLDAAAALDAATAGWALRTEATA